MLEKPEIKTLDEFKKLANAKSFALALNLGCGQDYRNPNDEKEKEYYWINVDLDMNVKADERIALHELHTKYFNEIRFIEARDVIEHIPVSYQFGTGFDFFNKTLKSLVSCLVLDGEIRVQVPDPYELFYLLQKGEIDEIDYNRRIFSIHSNDYNIHYQLFSRGRIKRILMDHGLRIDHEKTVNGNAIVTGRRVR